MRTQALEERPRWRREDPAALARYVVPAEAERWFPASRLMHWGLATTAGRGEAAKVIYDFAARQPEKLLYAQSSPSLSTCLAGKRSGQQRGSTRNARVVASTSPCSMPDWQFP